MKRVELPLIELVGIAATRGMLGAGLALLLGERLRRRERRGLGLLLTTVGLVTTIPFAWDLLTRRSGSSNR